MREIKLLLEGCQSINLSGDDNSSKDCQWRVKAITEPQEKICTKNEGHLEIPYHSSLTDKLK